MYLPRWRVEPMGMSFCASRLNAAPEIPMKISTMPKCTIYPP